MSAVEEYRCADCGAILAHPGEKHTHEDCCRHWQHRAAKATEYARIEVKRKNEAVERECEAIELAERAEAENERLITRYACDVICGMGVRGSGSCSNPYDAECPALPDFIAAAKEEPC